MAMWIPTELPLFRRELTELAQRRRTYLIRSIGAIALLTFVVYTVVQMTQTAPALPNPALLGGMAGPAGPFAGMGIGTRVFSRIIPLLFLMIPALLPALCSSAIASEKEQNTFGTLLLTRLSPSTIVLEKLLSRIVPMLTLLLLVSPVLAYVYSLGGVDPGMLFGAVWLLFCECLLFASLSMFFSAWFPSTVTAFVWSYIATGVLLVIGNIFPLTAFGVWNNVVGFASFMNPGTGPLSGADLFVSLASQSVYPVLIAIILLIATRTVLVRRAFVGHSSFLLGIFRRLDQFFKDLNAWTTGGIELVPESNRLPDNDPVTWRERNKKSLGQFRWLVRVLLVLEGPTMLICALAAVFDRVSGGLAINPLLALLWIFASILAAVKGASLFSQERSRQTLEPLLSTTLSSYELVQQKVAGTNRLLLVLACPIVTVYLTQAYMSWRANPLWTSTYLVLSISLMFVILRGFVWISAAVGMRVRSQVRAITFAITLVGVIAIVPMIIQELVLAGIFTGAVPGGWGYRLTGFSAPGAVMAIQSTFLSDFTPRYGNQEQMVSLAQIVISGLVIQLIYLALVRWIVLRLAPRLFQRMDSASVAPRTTVSSSQVEHNVAEPVYG